MAKDAELEHLNALLGEAFQHKQEIAFQSMKCAYDNPSWAYDRQVALLPVAMHPKVVATGKSLGGVSPSGEVSDSLRECSKKIRRAILVLFSWYTREDSNL